jgi:hypothetical protein
MNVITEMYFLMGHYAFLCGEPFDEDENFAWKQGWKAAQQEKAGGEA